MHLQSNYCNCRASIINVEVKIIGSDVCAGTTQLIFVTAVKKVNSFLAYAILVLKLNRLENHHRGLSIAATFSPVSGVPGYVLLALFLA